MNSQHIRIASAQHWLSDFNNSSQCLMQRVSSFLGYMHTQNALFELSIILKEVSMQSRKSRRKLFSEENLSLSASIKFRAASGLLILRIFRIQVTSSAKRAVSNIPFSLRQGITFSLKTLAICWTFCFSKVWRNQLCAFWWYCFLPICKF